MAKDRQDQLLVPSVLDRLIDLEPGNSRETPKTRHQVLRELKESVRRDLENLLNTPWRATDWPSELEELNLSLANYGIPNFTGTKLGNERDREEFRRTIERAIRNFEPRFKTVKVSYLKNASELDRTLRFRVDAMLYAEPAPEPVVFDTAIEPGSGNVQVKGGSR